jgi:hypothetical protein
MGAVTVVNIREVIAGLNSYEAKVEKAAEFGVLRAALAIERQTKLNANTGVHARGQGHIPGTGPGPNVVTGTLRRSITTEVKYGFGSYIAVVGPTVEYARAVELGSSRWKSGVRYPYLYPAVGYLVNSGQLNRVFMSAFTSALKG